MNPEWRFFMINVIMPDALDLRERASFEKETSQNEDICEVSSPSTTCVRCLSVKCSNDTNEKRSFKLVLKQHAQTEYMWNG